MVSMIDDHLEKQGDEEATDSGASTADSKTREPVTSPFGEPVAAAAPAPEQAAASPAAEAEESVAEQPEAEEPEVEEPVAEEPEAEDEADDGKIAAVQDTDGEPGNPKLKWYAVHTYSGHENKVRTNLLKRIAVEEMDWEFGHVLVPTEEVTEMKQGKKTVSNRKYFPSYILVEMEMCDKAYHLVNQISGVTRFVGHDQKDSNKRPVSLRPHEVDRILGRIERPTEHKVSEIPYMAGDHIHVIDGPFSDFNGVVDNVNPERGTLKVMVTIFGRETPVELDFLQVEPI
jgi:transcriptional antiterminator NusG